MRDGRRKNKHIEDYENPALRFLSYELYVKYNTETIHAAALRASDQAERRNVRFPPQRRLRSRSRAELCDMRQM